MRRCRPTTTRCTPPTTPPSRRSDRRSAQRHPSYVGGVARPSDEVVRTVSPVDRDVVIGEFAVASAGDVADAVGAAADAAGVGGHGLARAVRPARPGRRRDQRRQRPARRGDGVGGGQEPPGGARRRRGVGRPDPLLHPRHARQRRLRAADGAAEPGRGDVRRDAPVRRVGGDQPVQLPDGAGRRPRRRGAGRRQHGRAQAVGDRVVVRPPPLRRARRCRACRRGWSTW